MRPTPPLDIETTRVLIVDLQERLLPHIYEASEVVAQSVRLVRLAGELQLPVTISEQYPAALGGTHPAVLQAAPQAAVMQKLTFSACGDADLLRQLSADGRTAVLVAGVEAHVCVQQTCLDLLRAGLAPTVLADAVSSRRVRDRDIALDRLRQAGVVVTTVESAVFELLRRCDTPLFRRALTLLK